MEIMYREEFQKIKDIRVRLRKCKIEKINYFMDHLPEHLETVMINLTTIEEHYFFDLKFDNLPASLEKLKISARFKPERDTRYDKNPDLFLEDLNETKRIVTPTESMKDVTICVLIDTRDRFAYYEYDLLSVL